MRASSPVDIAIRSRATITWIPFDGRICVANCAPALARTVSVQAPTASATCLALTDTVWPVS